MMRKLLIGCAVGSVMVLVASAEAVMIGLYNDDSYQYAGPGTKTRSQHFSPSESQNPLSDDFKTVQWNGSEAGYQTWQWIVDVQMKHKAAEEGSLGGRAGLCAGTNAIMMTHVGHIGRVTTDCPEGTDWGTFELPSGPAGPGNMGTFWPLAITAKAAMDPGRLDASIKFLQFAAGRDAQVGVTERAQPVHVGGQRKHPRRHAFESHGRLRLRREEGSAQRSVERRIRHEPLLPSYMARGSATCVRRPRWPAPRRTACRASRAVRGRRPRIRGARLLPGRGRFPGRTRCYRSDP